MGKRLPSMLASRPSDLATRLKILTSKQMLQRLPIALAQVLNEIKYTKKVYNNIMNSIKF